METSDEEMRRLRWHCRRGMLELDHLLLGFVAHGYFALGAQERKCFKDLLECQDQDLSDWLMARRVPEDPERQAMVQHIVDVAGASKRHDSPACGSNRPR